MVLFEGGYDLVGLAKSVHAGIDVLTESGHAVEDAQRIATSLPPR